MTELWIAVISVGVLNIALSACCPQRCRCDERRKIVFCNERNLQQIPYNIPSNTKVLLLQGNALENHPNLESILGSLTQLKKLDMHENKLTSFPNNLPASLTSLSLRSNAIKFVSKHALKGLSNLRELHLDYNNITNLGLRSGAFVAATSLEDLVLSNNALTMLPVGLPFSLRSLRLAYNTISSVSSRSLESLRNIFLLDLSNNLLETNLGDLKHLSVLKVLDLTNNRLTNFPSNLPTNLTELRLSSNQIQYIYAHRGNDYGDLQNLNKLEKLDISFNRLRSIQKGSFNALPPSLSMELQGNPWACDCNLVYLKQWLTFTTIVLASRDEMKCATPPAFSDVTLDAIDQEALKCEHSPRLVKIGQIKATELTVELGTDKFYEPPFVIYSVMYGPMLCDDCTLQGGFSQSSYTNAHMWIEEYTITPISPGSATEISSLKPNTQYAICIVTSYQHPDQVGVEQCKDVRTLSISTERSPHTKAGGRFPWIEIGGAVGATLMLAAVICTVVVYHRHRSSQQLLSKRHNVTTSPTHYTAGRGRPLVDANREFDVTLVMRQDLQRQSDSCYSDSHDESLATTHTGTMTSRNSDPILKYAEDSTETYLTPIAFSRVDNNARVSSPNDSGLCL